MTDLKTIGMPVRFSKLKLIQLLSQRYPEHKWDTLYMWRGKYAQQKRLEHTLIALFPVSGVASYSPPTTYLSHHSCK